MYESTLAINLSILLSRADIRSCPSHVSLHLRNCQSRMLEDFRRFEQSISEERCNADIVPILDVETRGF